MVEQFLQYIQYEKNYSSHTVLSYRNDIYQFLAFVDLQPANFSPALVSEADIQRWILSLMSDNIDPKSVSRKISALRSLWKYLMRQSYAGNSPVSGVVLPKLRKPLPAFFKNDELERALDNLEVNAVDYRSVLNYAIVYTLFATGIRLSELIYLNRSDVDAIAGTIKVTGKRNKQRIVPVSVNYFKRISEYIKLRDNLMGETENLFFLFENGKQLYAKYVYNIVHALMGEFSSQSKRSPHVLRHSFATALLNNGADLNSVKELLGHSSLSSTQVYVHTSFAELQKSYNQAHPRANI